PASDAFLGRPRLPSVASLKAQDAVCLESLPPPRSMWYSETMEIASSNPGGEHGAPARGYTASEAARLLEISVGEVHAWVRAAVIEPRRGPRNEYRFSFHDLVV